MIDDPSYKAELIYGLDISDLDPHSDEFKQTTDLICLCRFYDRFNGWLMAVEHNALLRAIERQCEIVGMPFESLDLQPDDEGDWRDQLVNPYTFRQPRQTRKKVTEMDEVIARRIAVLKLADYQGVVVLRRGPPIRDDKGWRFAVRPVNTLDVPFDGQDMGLMMWVKPDELLI